MAPTRRDTGTHMASSHSADPSLYGQQFLDSMTPAPSSIPPGGGNADYFAESPSGSSWRCGVPAGDCLYFVLPRVRLEIHGNGIGALRCIWRTRWDLLNLAWQVHLLFLILMPSRPSIHR